ncbi:ParB N-terminal domain-containing protein [Paracoccus caeni]|uniref:ParB N-terminal domain-containing protein n=1 Tax=Paracoccus caeni TaxID=657651 RepID=A0A934SFV9_9RHOB|nr:ParB N-terminal domain-containing protein [Paracoccus caeni]MBK4218120.1 ParB N-terminal domain-containing protein [Paracoccus caeni]
MAKRKRLSAFGMMADTEHETPPLQRIPPVARIAADAAAQAALDDLADELRQARDTGRMVVELPLSAIDAGHLRRDRMRMDPEEMDVLKASIADRGQQAPIEVVALDEGRFGLISGARRLAALEGLHRETGDARFGQVKALLRPFERAPEAYLAMVEENEIRADLSFYERARLAYEAARIGIFGSPAAAVKELFVHAAPPKRSKILNFVALHKAIGPALHFPEAIPEKLGLALVRALELDPKLAKTASTRLREAAPATAAEERAVLEAILRPASRKDEAQDGADDPDFQLGDGLHLKGRAGRAVLSGHAVTNDLLRDLAEWLKSRS